MFTLTDCWIWPIFKSVEVDFILQRHEWQEMASSFGRVREINVDGSHHVSVWTFLFTDIYVFASEPVWHLRTLSINASSPSSGIITLPLWIISPWKLVLPSGKKCISACFDFGYAIPAWATEPPKPMKMWGLHYLFRTEIRCCLPFAFMCKSNCKKLYICCTLTLLPNDMNIPLSCTS